MLNTVSIGTAFETDGPIEEGAGCLLQIHPLQIDSGLINLSRPVFNIGRDDQCALTLQESSISRQHAVIERAEEGYYIADQGSTNGTWVNEQRVERQFLTPGDRVRLGSVVFKFLSTTHIEAHYHEAVYSMMTRDSLTGVWNKRYFLEVLEREITRNRRHDRPTSLIMLDIDHFKSVNDTYGHLAGDEVLRELGQRLQTILRDDEVLARYGGEEFVILLGEVNADTAADTAERCRASIADAPFPTPAGELNVTISLGVADTLELTSDTPSALMDQADLRLYAAKNAGRNRVC